MRQEDATDADRALLARQRVEMIDPATEAVEGDAVLARRVGKVAELHTLAECLAEVHLRRAAVRNLREAGKPDQAAAELDRARAFTDEVACSDVDGDGKVDIVCSQSRGPGLPIRWFRNLGGDPPQWKPSDPVSPLHAEWRGEQGWMGTWCGDIDGDGDRDIVSGAKGGFGGVSHPVCWFENEAGDGSGWREHLLPVQGDYVDNCRCADFDGDGRDDIVVQHYNGGGVYYLTCPAPADPRKTGNWRRFRAGGGAHGLSIADVDGDRRLDIVVDATWLRNPGDPARDAWQAFAIAPGVTGVKNAAGDLDGDGRTDVVLSSEEGEGIWTCLAPEDPRSGAWVRAALGEEYRGVHTLWLADFNGDGRLDILAAEMHTKGKHRVAVFENVNARENAWREHVLAATGSHNAVACDVNGDGRPDVIGCNFAPSDNPLEAFYGR